jgi:hypothetical protein
MSCARGLDWPLLIGVGFSSFVGRKLNGLEVVDVFAGDQLDANTKSDGSVKKGEKGSASMINAEGTRSNKQIKVPASHGHAHSHMFFGGTENRMHAKFPF